MSASSVGGAGSGGSAAERLTPAQVFKVLDNVHSGKVAEAEMATARASSADVVAFAQSVGAAHEQAAAELSALEKQQAVVPMDSTLSLTVAATSRVEVDNLTSAAAASFDQTFLQGQIADHARLGPLVAKLQSMTTDGDIEDSLQALLAMTDEHHGQATTLLAGL